MNLRDVFNTQKEFESLFVDFERLEDPEYLDSIADYLSTALAKEAFEFRDEFNWKISKRRRLHNRDKQVEEAVDCFTFAINLFLILGVTPEEALESFYLKNKINWDRQIDEGNQKAIARISERTKSTDMEMPGMS